MINQSELPPVQTASEMEDGEVVFLMRMTNRPESEVRDFLNMRDFNEQLEKEMSELILANKKADTST